MLVTSLRVYEKPGSIILLTSCRLKSFGQDLCSRPSWSISGLWYCKLVCTVWPGSSAEALSVLAEEIYSSHCFYTDVPQGSVFGPASLLYSIQIYSPRIFYTLYADDISLSVLSPEWLTCLTYFCRAPWHFTLAREKHLLRFLVFSDRESIQNVIRQLHWLPPQVCYHSHPVEL